MKAYWQRLKEHPGVGYATLFTVLGALAGASNESLPVHLGLIFGSVIVGGFCWLCVLLTNLKK